MVDLKVWISVVVLAGTAYGKFLIKKLIATYKHMIKISTVFNKNNYGIRFVC